MANGLPPLANIQDLFPDGVVRMGQDRGTVRGDAGPGVTAGRSVLGNLSGPAQRATGADARRLNPSPEDGAASVLASAAQGGTRDSFGAKLLEAGAQSAGPLAAVFAGLGAHLAGKNPDFAAAMANEGFRQLERDKQARQQIREQAEQRHLQNRIATIRLAASANVPAKTVRDMVEGVMLDMGYQGISEGEISLISNRTEVRDIIFAEDGPLPKEAMQAYLQFVEAERPPMDSLPMQLANQRIQNEFASGGARSGRRASGAGTIEQDIQRGLALGELQTRESAMDSLMPNAIEAWGDPEIARMMVSLAVPDNEHVKVSDVNSIRNTFPEIGKPTGDLGYLLARELNIPEAGPQLAAMDPMQAGRVASELRQLRDVPPDVFLRQAYDQVYELGQPLSAGQAAGLRLLLAEQSKEALNAGRGIEREIYEIGADLEGATPEMKQSARELRAGKAQLMSAVALVPEILAGSETLKMSVTEDELVDEAVGMYDEVNLGGIFGR